MPGTMIGQGLYDAAELARLLGRDPAWVIRWSTPSRSGPAVVSPTFARRFSFSDLVSFQVARIIRDRGISDRHLRVGVETLRSRSGLPRPLSSRDVISTLATSGDSFLSDLGGGEFEDIGRSGQGVFQDVVGIHLARVEFDGRGVPERWSPTDGIVIDPAIQAGAPCIAGTRVPTATIAAMLTDDEAEDVAMDLDLSLESVRRAEAFEEGLASGLRFAA